MLCLSAAGLCPFSPSRLPPLSLSLCIALTAGRTPSNYYAICVRAGKTNVLSEWQPVESETQKKRKYNNNNKTKEKE